MGSKFFSRVFRRLSSLPRTIRRRWWALRIERFRARYLRQAAPLEVCVQFRRQAADIFGNEDALTPRPEKLIRKGGCLRDRELAEIFSGIEFSVWSPPVDTIDWIADFIYRERPRIVLEFGSGVTTVCLWVLLKQIHGADGFRLLSLDQDPREAERTRDGLRRLDATSFSCRVVCAPLIPAVVDGRATFFYDVRLCREHFAWLGKAEFVFIDGPFSEGPCRYGTLSRVREHLVPGARFVMDDALREKELAAGALWAREGIVVDGVLTLGEGIMVGSVLPRLD